jgi:prepilin-type N-terminal cleavage/methylation domain-containing protein
MTRRGLNISARRDRRYRGRRRRLARRASGFTLIELLTVVVIVSILLALSGLAFRRITDGNVLAQARNMVVTYAKIARGYAIANHIETMMVVNPFNGRFEIWYLSAPSGGGPFDPLSEITADGYRFAPVFDSSAGIPVDGNGRPVAAVHPIDYADPDLSTPGNFYRSTAADPDERNLDNLTWAAFCFDETGRLVIRTRRIATRTYTHRDGSPRLPLERNRLLDETPDLVVAPLVNGIGTTEPLKDTAITSTRGFVISDVSRLRQVVPNYAINADDLVNKWLVETPPNGRYASFATTVVLNRFTGQELIGGRP